MSAGTVVGVAVAGSAGAVCRFVVDGAVRDRVGGRWPWGTFVVNVTGSFVLGLVVGAALYHGLSPGTRSVLGTGFVGAYTTFSTWTFDTVRLVEEGAPAAALWNVVGSVAAGCGAGALGLWLAALL